MKKIYSLIILSTLFFTGAVAQSQTYNFSLQEAIDYAYQNQASMKNAELDVEIAKNKVRETTAIGLPQVNGTASFNKFLDVPTQVLPDFLSPSLYKVLMQEGVRDSSGNRITFPDSLGGNIGAKFGTNYTFNYGLEASMIIFDGTYLVGLQAASTYKELSQKSLQRTKIETSVAVTKAYYLVLVSEEGLKIIDANLERLKKTLDDTKAMNQNGFVEKIDVSRLEVIYNNTLTQRLNIERQSKLSIEVLKFQIGMPINNTLTLKDRLENVQMQPVLAQDEAVNIENRVEYSLLQTQLRLNQLDVRRYTISRAPSLIAFANWSQSTQSDNFSDLGDQYYPTTVVGFKLTVPIIGSGQKTFQGRQAKLSMLKTENDIKNLENAINLESKQSQINFNNNIASLENQRKNMELAQEVLRVSKAKYDQGLGSSLELTTAETSLREAQTNYITSLYDALVAKVEMDKAYGRIQ